MRVKQNSTSLIVPGNLVHRLILLSENSLYGRVPDTMIIQSIFELNKKSVGILPVAHPTHQGLRIAQQSERTTQKAHVYINPMRERIEICNNVYLRQFTARHNIPTVNIYCCLVL